MSGSCPFLPMRERRVRSAFTITEVLVSSAILACLMILLLGMTDGVSRIWGDGERRREPLREAGASLRLISEDLRSAVITQDADSLLVRNEGASGESLFLLVSHPDDPRPSAEDGQGDLCATGYFLAEGEEGESNLYRFHARGEEVISALRSHGLGGLYATAAPGATNTELLARRIPYLGVERLNAAEEGAVRITVVSVGGSTARRIASGHLSGKQLEELLLKKGTRLSETVALPPPRLNRVTP